MSFPINPATGDTFTLDDTVWTFNGRNWDRTVVGPRNETNYAPNYALLTTALLSRIEHLENVINQGFLLID